MNSQRIDIGGQSITLNANVWTLLEYKRVFKKDWYAARNEQLQELIKSIEFQQKFAFLLDSDLEKMTDEEHESLFKKLEEEGFFKKLEGAAVDMEFTLNTIYAMALSGGYKGTQQDLFSKIAPKDLAENSDLLKTVSELIFEMLPKKNNIIA